jgi:parallel beta-helix repeat protein
MNSKDREDFLRRPALDLMGMHKKKRLELARRWGAERDLSAVEPLGQVARNTSEDVDIRLAAIQALGAIQSEAASLILQQTVSDSLVGHATISALAQMRNDYAAKALIESWAQARGSQTDEINLALSGMGQQAITTPLIAALDHPSQTVRNQAERALLRLNGATPFLVHALQDDRLRAGAAGVLAKIGKPAADLLLQSVAEGSTLQAQAVKGILSGMGADVVPGLIAGLSNAAEQVRRVAAEMLLGMVDPVAEALKPTLTEWLHAPDMPKPISVAPDGSGDFRSVAEAVAAAAPGAMVRVCAGEHGLSERLDIRKPLVLVGEGMETTRITGHGEDFLISIGGEISVTAIGITFTRRSQAAGGVIFAVSAEMSLLRCRVDGAKGPQPNLDEMYYRERSAYSGVVIGGKCKGVVTACEFVDNAGYGIVVGLKANAVLEQNTCRGSNTGILLMDLSHTTARKNTCSGNRHGILANDSAIVELDQNVCQENRSNGMSFVGGASGSVTRNHCVRNREHGIQISQIARPELEGNLCERNGIQGIHYNTGNELVPGVPGLARSNRCIGNGYDGISIINDGIPTIELNECIGNNVGISICGQARPKLLRNTCKENKMNGIEYHESARGTASGNHCTGNNAGIIVGDTAEPMLEGNTCSSNKQIGIGFLETAGGGARGNTCTNNEIGIFSDSARASFHDNRCSGNSLTDSQFA